MRRHLGWALASVISLGLSGGAMAADMPLKAAPAPIPEIFSWTGFLYRRQHRLRLGQG